MKGQEEFLTVQEAARRSGVSTDTIRRRLRAGSLPGSHRGGEGAAPWSIPESALQASGLAVPQTPIENATDDTEITWLRRLVEGQRRTINLQASQLLVLTRALATLAAGDSRGRTEIARHGEGCGAPDDDR